MKGDGRQASGVGLGAIYLQAPLLGGRALKN